MADLTFEVIQERDGGFCAACEAAGIFAQGDDWSELEANVRDAAEAFQFDVPVHRRRAVKLPRAVQVRI